MALEEPPRRRSGLEEVTICVLDSPQFKAFEAAITAASPGALTDASTDAFTAQLTERVTRCIEDKPIYSNSAHTLHWYALAFMGLVYIIRITWFVKRFKAGGERQAATGIPGRTTPIKGDPLLLGERRHALGHGEQPEESVLLRPVRRIPSGRDGCDPAPLHHSIWPGPFWKTMQWSWRFEFPLERLSCGLGRIVRRFGDKYMRAISSPDDYFSLILLTAWFFFAFLAVPNSTANGEWHLLGLFLPGDVLPGLRPLQQDLSLPLLPLHPVLPRKEPRAQRCVPHPS